jgi:microcystin-dependent protein
MNDVYEHLTRHDSFNTSGTAPDNPSEGTIWYDDTYEPPLAKRWDGVQWKWEGTYIYRAGDTFPPESPSKGAVRVNAETGVTEYWDGNFWVAVTVATGGGTFSGAGAYLWDRTLNTPDGIFNPVIGYGMDVNPEGKQTGSDGGTYRDMFVIGGNALQFNRCMYYNMNAGNGVWRQVTGLDAVAASLGLEPSTVVTVERIVGFDGDSALPTGTNSTPFIFAIIRSSTGGDTGYHYVVGIRITDDGVNLAGMAVKGIVVPTALSADSIAACIYNGYLRLGGINASNIACLWAVTWNETNFSLDTTQTTEVGNFSSPVTSMSYYYTQDTPAITLKDGRYAGSISGFWQVGNIASEEFFHENYFVQPDNRIVVISNTGRVYQGTGGTLANIPNFEGVADFDGVNARILDGCISAKRHTELLVGTSVIYGIEYGAIYERKMGSKEYNLVWQSEFGDVNAAISYGGARNIFITAGMDSSTGELTALYNSDLRSVADYFTSINDQLRTLTTIVNQAMYKGGAKKGEIKAWTGPADKVPEGWAICDGHNDIEFGGPVPDLRGRFLRHINSGETVTSHGGSNAATLLEINMPPHTHDMANHIHPITLTSHTHTMTHTHSYTGGSHAHAIGGVAVGSGTGSFSATGPVDDHEIEIWVPSLTHRHQQKVRYIQVQAVATGTNIPYASDSGTFAIATQDNTSLRQSLGTHWHGGSASISATVHSSVSVNLPGSTGAASPGLQITAYSGSTGPAAGNNSATGVPSNNATGTKGGGQPFKIEPPFYAVMWIIATRDHAAAEGVDTSFLSADQMMAILMATDPSAENRFLTLLDLPTLPPGPPGVSAYELAVTAGFTGTAEQWLDSLHGPEGESAYVAALDLGFVGTKEEWLASLKGREGVDGANGESAYNTAVANGYVGTEQEWIASLHGVGLPAGGAIGQVATKFAASDYSVEWKTPTFTDEVQVFDHIPTDAEMLLIPDDTLLMIGNTDPSVTPFGVSNLTYDNTQNEVVMTLIDGRELTATIPTCSMTQDGLMASEDCATFHELVSTVETLAQGGVFRDSFDTFELFTADRAAYGTKGYTATAADVTNYNVSDFIFVNSDSSHANVTTSYILMLDTAADPQVHYWAFRKDEVTQIQRATNAAMGIVQGSANDPDLGTTDGKIRVESDGTMTLNGWNRVVENKMDINSAGIAQHLIEFGPNKEAADSGVTVEDLATAAQGLRADNSVQKPASVVAGNLMEFDAVGNAVNAGRSVDTLVSKDRAAEQWIELCTARPNYVVSSLATGDVTVSAVPIATLASFVGNTGVGNSDGVIGYATEGRALRFDPANASIADINNSLKYSTTETPTGATWVDGTPIYRRVYTGQTQADTTTSPIGTLDPNHRVVSVTGMISDPGSGQLCPSGTMHPTYGSWHCYVGGATGYVYAYALDQAGAYGGGWLGLSCHIIVEYVK